MDCDDIRIRAPTDINRPVIRICPTRGLEQSGDEFSRGWDLSETGGVDVLEEDVVADEVSE